MQVLCNRALGANSSIYGTSYLPPKEIFLIFQRLWKYVKIYNTNKQTNNRRAVMLVQSRQSISIIQFFHRVDLLGQELRFREVSSPLILYYILYSSFKIVLCFWLALICWLILHNQLALTKFGRCEQQTVDAMVYCPKVQSQPCFQVAAQWPSCFGMDELKQKTKAFTANRRRNSQISL